MESLRYRATFIAWLMTGLAFGINPVVRGEDRAMAIDPALFPHAAFVVQIDGLIDAVDVSFNTNRSVIITDAGRSRLLTFSLEGALIDSSPMQPRTESDPAPLPAPPSWLHDRVGRLPGQFNRPEDMHQHGDQFIVADTHNHRLQLLDALGGALAIFHRTSPTPHTGRGSLRAPSAVTVSPDGRYLAVCERIEQRCQIFDLQTRAESGVEIDDTVALMPAMYGPGAAIGGGALALWFPGEQKVMLVDAMQPHHMITEFGQRGNRPSQFTDISDLIMTPTNAPHELRVIVADRALGRLTEIRVDRSQRDELGNARHQFRRSADVRTIISGMRTSNITHPFRIDAMTTNADGSMYLLDTHNAVIIKLDAQLKPVSVIDTHGEAQKRFLQPVDLDIDPRTQELFVLDAGRCEIMVFHPDGLWKRSFGGRGEDEGALMYPTAIAIDLSSGAWIADAGRGHIVRFNGNGLEPGTIGQRGDGEGEFARPTDLMIPIDGASQGRIAVVDESHQRVLFFDANRSFIGHFGARRMEPMPKATWND